jgi:hypothetical protein
VSAKKTRFSPSKNTVNDIFLTPTIWVERRKIYFYERKFLLQQYFSFYYYYFLFFAIDELQHFIFIRLHLCELSTHWNWKRKWNFSFMYTLKCAIISLLGGKGQWFWNFCKKKYDYCYYTLTLIYWIEEACELMSRGENKW